jgi:predicted double-glycine peptidase
MDRQILAALGLSLALAAEVAPLDVPFFRQEKNGCGAASVAMVVHYWAQHAVQSPHRLPAPAEVYQQLYDAERKGILLSAMKSYFEALGFHAFSFRGAWKDLESNASKGRPVIVGMKRNRAERFHFVVLIGAGNDRVWLNDPSKKRAHTLKRKEFEEQWAAADRWMLVVAPKPDR